MYLCQFMYLFLFSSAYLLQKALLTKHNLTNQLANVRLHSQQKYITSKSAPNIPTVNVKCNDDVDISIPGKFGILPPVSDKEPWEKGTCLIIGDSLLSNVIERKMGPKFKVRNIPGCVINDLYYHVTPLLLKNPSSVIIMAGTNDATTKKIF